VSGFSGAEIQAVEEYMRAFKCYDHHRTVRASSSQTEYWYESRIDGARLNRNLRLMLEHMNVGAQVTMSGNIFALGKVATR
jgi:limonene-1,2-epoxide hydrolase